MAQEAIVKITLDTKQAKAELRDLNKLAAGGVSRVGGGGGGGGGGFGRVGSFLMGGALGGATFGALRGSVSAGATDILTETFGPAITSITNSVFQGRNLEAQANKAAFEQLPFRLIGHLGRVPRGVIELHKHKKALILEGLNGRRIADDSGLFATAEGNITKIAVESPIITMKWIFNSAVKQVIRAIEKFGEGLKRGNK